MEAYTSFAQVYDTFMDNVPYEDWSDRIRTILRQYGITGGLALDLGCGTGKMTELLAEAGFDMIGVDNSEDMLELAMEKRLVSGHDILYLLQDMQEFELYGTVGAIVSVCDSINYITDEEELLEVFRLANNYLDPHGIFLLTLIRSTSTGRFWGTTLLQRSGRNVVLSGRTTMIQRKRSMSMS